MTQPPTIKTIKAEVKRLYQDIIRHDLLTPQPEVTALRQALVRLCYSVPDEVATEIFTSQEIQVLAQDLRQRHAAYYLHSEIFRAKAFIKQGHMIIFN
ncbi:hypothetical protein QUF58_10830 [Anaerolineales bacterium HSG24]|nr:hypothetical protein [Anaerolineales bacterium HSG24]